jgi:hypothetical protein
MVSSKLLIGGLWQLLDQRLRSLTLDALGDI